MVNVKAHTRKTKKGRTGVKSHVRKLPPLWEKTDRGMKRNRRNFLVLTREQSNLFTPGGDSLQGGFENSYDEVKRVFGEPTISQKEFSKGSKTDAEWNVVLDDGTHFSIYNYKDGNNYLGAEGLPLSKITDWHVGGRHGDTNKIMSFLKEKGFNVGGVN